MKKIHVMQATSGNIVNMYPMRAYKRKSRKIKGGMSSNVVYKKATIVYLDEHCGKHPKRNVDLRQGSWTFLQGWSIDNKPIIVTIYGAIVTNDYDENMQGRTPSIVNLESVAIRKSGLSPYRKAYLDHFREGQIKVNLSANRNPFGSTHVDHLYRYEDPSKHFTEEEKKDIAAKYAEVREKLVDADGNYPKHSYQWVDLSDRSDNCNPMIIPNVRAPYPLRQVDIDRSEAQTEKDSGDGIELRKWEDEFGTPFSFTSETEIGAGVDEFAKDLLDKIIGLEPPNENVL